MPQSRSWADRSKGNNLQAAGTNKEKKGLYQTALSTYKEARQKSGTLKDAWTHARQPSDIKLARETKIKQMKLAQLAKQHQTFVAGGKGAYRGTPWE